MTRHGPFALTTALRRRGSTETHVRFAAAPVISHANPVRITAASSPTKPGHHFLDTPAARNVSVRDRRWHTPQHKSP
jgi:fumarate reductase subunit C